MKSETVIKKYFPKVYHEPVFIQKTYTLLNKYGFNANNTIASVDVCRDEISQPFVALVEEKWGEAFNLCSLAGMFFAGKTGLKAAMHHAPIVKGKERYVFYALPHIAIDAKGQLGVCKRKGRKADSHACGALNVFLSELKNRKTTFTIDNEDIELSLIKTRLLAELPYGQVPNLLDLTKITLNVIKKDFENALKQTVDTKHSDYAFISGIQIHAPHGNFISPDDFYVVVRNKKKNITI
jgi:hypothetical protein